MDVLGRMMLVVGLKWDALEEGLVRHQQKSKLA